METKYCSKCGRELKTRIVGAEHFMRDYCYNVPYDAYNKYTGKRNFITEYRCPKERVWNDHDTFGRFSKEQREIIEE